MELLVNIDVDDLQAASEFYCAAFELRIGRRFGAHAIELLGASSAIYLLAHLAGSSPSKFTRQTRTYERHWSPIHVDFVVADLEPALQKAIAAGAKLEK